MVLHSPRSTSYKNRKSFSVVGRKLGELSSSSSFPRRRATATSSLSPSFVAFIRINTCYWILILALFVYIFGLSVMISKSSYSNHGSSINMVEDVASNPLLHESEITSSTISELKNDGLHEQTQKQQKKQSEAILNSSVPVLNFNELHKTSNWEDADIMRLIEQEMNHNDIANYSPERYLNVTSIEDRYKGKNYTVVEKKAHFVLHIGINKTATSSIQEAMMRHFESLQLDGYEYMGKVYNGKFVKKNATNLYNKMNRGRNYVQGLLCKTDKAKYADTKTSITNMLRNTHKTVKTNMVMSFEDLSALVPPLCGGAIHRDPSYAVYILSEIKSIFDEVGFYDVSIVIAYRRFHEWLKSLYNFVFHYEKQSLIERELVSIPIYLKQYSSNMHPTILYRDLWSRFFDKVHVLDYHSGGNIVEDFICKYLPGANHTCAAVKEETFHKNESNDQSPNINLLMKELLKRHRNILKKKKIFRSVLRRVSDNWNTLVNSSFLNMNMMNCTDDELQKKLIVRTVVFEKMLFSERSNRESDIALYKKAKEKFEGLKYCAVDAAKVVDKLENVLVGHSYGLKGAIADIKDTLNIG